MSSDGSIHVSTKINTEPVKKGLNDVEKAAAKSGSNVRKSLNELGAGFKILGQKAASSAKSLLSGYNENVAVLDRQSVALEKLQRQLDGIMSGDVVPTSLRSMETELAKRKAETRDLATEMDALQQEKAQLNGEISKSEAEHYNITNLDEVKTRLAEIDLQLSETIPKWDAAGNAAVKLEEKTQQLRLNPEATSEAQDLNNRIALLKQQMGESEQKATSFKDKLLGLAKVKFSKLGSATSSLKKGFEGVGQKLDNLKSRITRLVGAAFVFNLIRRGLSQLVSSLTSTLKSNSQFASSLNQIKANLMTAFAPIYNAILPAINTLMSALSKVTGTIATFIAGLFGKTANQAKSNAAALQSQAMAYENVGKSAEEAQGKLASFDTLEVNDAQKDTSSGSGGGSGDAVDFSGQIESSSWLLDMLNKIKDVLGQLFNPFKVAWDSVGAQVIESLKYAFTEVLALLVDIGRTFLEVWNNDLGVSIATRIFNIWININTLIGNVAKSFRKVWDEGDRGKKLVEALLGMFDKILGVCEGISKSLADFALSESFQTGIALTMDILTKIFDIIGWIAQAFSNAWDAHGLEILANAQSILNGVLRLVDSIAGSIQGWVMSENFQTALSIVLDIIGSILGWIGEIAAWVVDMYEKYVKPILEEKIIPLINTLIEVIKNIWTIAKPVIDFIVDALKVVLEPAIAAICWAFGAVIDVINFIATVFNTVLEIIIGIFTDIEGTAQKCWNWIVGVFEGAATWFNDTLVQPVKDFFSGMWNGLKDGAHNAWEGIKSVFGAVTGWFKDVFTRAWEGVKKVFETGGKIFSGIKEGIANVFKTVVNGIIDGINKVIAFPFNTINGFLNTIRAIDILGFKPFESLWGYNPLSVPQIPRLATGGVAYGPMVAQIGEYAGARSNPEIVTPENLMRQIVREEAGGGGNSSIDELTVIVKIGEETIQRQVIKSVRREERAIGKPLFAS